MNETSDIDALSNDQQMTETSLEQSTQEKGSENLNHDDVSVPNSQVIKKSIDTRNLKDGQRFQGIEKSTGKKFSGKIISSAGKKTGYNKHCYNVVKSCGWSGWMHMDRVQDLQLIPDETQMLIFFNSTEVIEAKEK